MRVRHLLLLLLATMLAPPEARGDAPLEALSVTPAAEAPDSSSADTRGYRFPSRRAQLKAWALNVTGPTAVAGNLAAASWRHWVTDEPPDWGDDARGFGKRFGTTTLITAISETSVSAVSALMRQDPAYYRSPSPGRMPRLGHAVAMTFLARDPAGGRVFSPAKTFSYFVGPAVTQASFYPEGHTAADVLVSGVYTLLINAALNVAHEFVLGAPSWGGPPDAPGRPAPVTAGTSRVP